ncbi:toll/interleukin-1 receptor domain-containing protein [Streptomyces sp. NPDC050485]|uniref:toll/interleukin-1 receptor domain-containing protein n=1 Tax=Streptomyces sp. NPDC050485 TaxID=3365617 RepID=UPI0037972E93
MHELFINYRTQGGKDAAHVFDYELSKRFGTNSVFRAQKSIAPGANYVETLIKGVRRSRVLLALIGRDWVDTPDPKGPGRRALANPKDWVRREIEEAFSSGVLVVPVLLGRHVEQIDPLRLPKSLATLAECQYERYSTRTAEADLTRLGDRLVRQVPELAALNAQAGGAQPAAEASRGRTEIHNARQSGGVGAVHGDLGTFINEAHGPLHTGSGRQINGPRINGDGTNYVAGDNRGGIRQRFGDPKHPGTGR